jgi:PAS domain-containing protein
MDRRSPPFLSGHWRKRVLPACHSHLKSNTSDVLIKALIVSGHEDTFARIVISLVDISERKRAEEALRISERKFREQALNISARVDK